MQTYAIFINLSFKICLRFESLPCLAERPEFADLRDLDCWEHAAGTIHWDWWLHCVLHKGQTTPILETPEAANPSESWFRLFAVDFEFHGPKALNISEAGTNKCWRLRTAAPAMYLFTGSLHLSVNLSVTVLAHVSVHRLKRQSSFVTVLQHCANAKEKSSDKTSWRGMIGCNFMIETSRVKHILYTFHKFIGQVCFSTLPVQRQEALRQLRAFRAVETELDIPSWLHEFNLCQGPSPPMSCETRKPCLNIWNIVKHCETSSMETWPSRL